MVTNAVCSTNQHDSSILIAQDCGNIISNGGNPAPDGSAGCNMACAGNNTEYCGGGYRLNMYEFGSSPGWNSIGCYNDSVVARTLTYPVAAPGGPANMTNENCQAVCLAAGYVLAGTEYSQECYCGNQLANYGAPATSGCDMTCRGDTSEICGGGNRLSLFNYTSPSSSTGGSPSTPATLAPSGWKAVGCYTDSVTARTLGVGMSVIGTMTVEGCIDACGAAGYALSGVEYGQECCKFLPTVKKAFQHQKLTSIGLRQCFSQRGRPGT